jgi:hypothetical protein
VFPICHYPNRLQKRYILPASALLPEREREGAMTDSLLEGLLKLGGVTALAIGVFYLLYSKILDLRVFARMSPRQTFATIALLAVLVWSTALIALIIKDKGFQALIIGSNNIIHQGLSDVEK